jgi:hypothetical protein
MVAAKLCGFADFCRGKSFAKGEPSLKVLNPDYHEFTERQDLESKVLIPYSIGRSSVASDGLVCVTRIYQPVAPIVNCAESGSGSV